MHVLEDSAIFAALQEDVIGQSTGRKKKRMFMQTIFITFICMIFFASLIFLHGMISDLENERTAGYIRVPGKVLNGNIRLQDESTQQKNGDDIGNDNGSNNSSGSVFIEFQVDNLDGIPGETGTFVIRTEPSWSKLGAQRVVDLTEDGFWSGCRFFRVINNFMAQFGINGDPIKNEKWEHRTIADEGVQESNRRGTVSFAMSGPGSRSNQLFINTKDNKYLDGQGFAPIGWVVEGMNVVDRLYEEYGEGAPRGKGPSQQKIQNQGNAYLEKFFPKLSYIVSAQVKSKV